MYSKKSLKDLNTEETVLSPICVARELNMAVPKYEIPEAETPPEVA